MSDQQPPGDQHDPEENQTSWQPEAPIQAPGEQPPDAPAPQAPFNTLAIVAFVGSFFAGLIGIICGHISLKQIKRDGSRGRGLALAGTIIGYVAFVGAVITLIVTLVVLGALANNASEVAQQLEQLEEETNEAPPEEGEPSEQGEATGERSEAFCTAFDNLRTVAIEADPTTEEGNEAVLDAYRALADVDSPNQAVYQDFVTLGESPEAATAEEVAELQSRFEAAGTEDAEICGVSLTD